MNTDKTPKGARVFIRVHLRSFAAHFVLKHFLPQMNANKRE